MTMRPFFSLSTLILVVSLLYLPQQGIAENSASPLAESQNQVIKVTDKGLEPALLEMKKEDRIAFIINDSRESLLTLSLNFGSHAAHCASENLQINDDGSIRSVKPIAPKDFATTCFHDPGTYPYTVYGIPSFPQGLKGSIVVK
jgi:hypothetical protein